VTCQGETPLVAQVARDYADRIGFLGVASRDSVEAMTSFVQEFGVGGFPHAADPDGVLWQRFGVPYQPAWVFIDSHGTAVRVLGSLQEQDLVPILEDLAQDRLPSA
jgi:hypothetical protein